MSGNKSSMSNEIFNKIMCFKSRVMGPTDYGVMGLAGPKNQVWKDISRALNSKISPDGVYTFAQSNRLYIQDLITIADEESDVTRNPIPIEMRGLVPQQNVGDSPPQPQISHVTTLSPEDHSILPSIQGEIETVPILGGLNTAQYEDISVRWNYYQNNMQAVFPILLTNELFVDVTLACEGRSIKCHKIILSACSTYFEQLLTENPCQHPIVLMKDLRFWEVQALVEFMYKGEVNIAEANLPNLLAAANALQIKGLAGSTILHKQSVSNGDSSPLRSPKDTSDTVSTSGVAPVLTPMPTPKPTPVLTPMPTTLSHSTSEHGRAYYRRIRKQRSDSQATTLNPPPLRPCPGQNIPAPSYYYQYDSPLNSGTHYMGLPSSTFQIEQDDLPPCKRRAQSPEITIDPIIIKTEPVDIDDYADENLYNGNDSMDPLGNIESEDQYDINTDENLYNEGTISMPHETDDTDFENSSNSSKGQIPEAEMDVGDQD